MEFLEGIPDWAYKDSSVSDLEMQRRKLWNDVGFDSWEVRNIRPIWEHEKLDENDADGRAIGQGSMMFFA
jgi:hypothetical protein